MLHIVLHEPEIPHNAGAIGRTCSVSGARLHLIKPLGFSTDEKHLRRTGLDYWHSLDVKYYESFEDFMDKAKPERLFLATTKALRTYTDVRYDSDSYIVFGKESKGLPEELLIKYKENCIRIPMLYDKRSINLSVSAGIILYEALRQNDFFGLTLQGELHNSSWDNV